MERTPVPAGALRPLDQPVDEEARLLEGERDAVLTEAAAHRSEDAREARRVAAADQRGALARGPLKGLRDLAGARIEHLDRRVEIRRLREMPPRDVEVQEIRRR